MVEINGSANPVSREQYKQQIAALREERVKLNASARRWDIATKIDTAVAVIALAPLTLLTGCPAQTTPSQPPYVPPVFPPVTDGEEGEIPSEGEGDVPSEGETEVPEGAFGMKSFSMTIEEGDRDANDTDPGGNVGPINVGVSTGILAVGYTNQDWIVRPFIGETAYNYILPENIDRDDLVRDNKEQVAWGLSGVYNYTTGNDVVRKADVTGGKPIAIINVDPNAVLYPGDYVTFPRILVKGDKVNELTGANLAQYLRTDAPFVDEYNGGNGVHDDLEMYYETGLSIAFRRSAPYKQIRLYTYANGDPLTAVAGGSGRVLDPRVTTASFYSWVPSISDKGVPPMMYGQMYEGDAYPYMFNTFPLIDLAEPAEAKISFLTSPSSLPEESAGFPYSIAGLPENQIQLPPYGIVYYNTDRNTVPVNGFQIEDRSQAGLLYVSPGESSRNLTGVVHNQFVLKFPFEGVGIPEEVLENGASMAVRFASVESGNTKSLESDPSFAYRP